MTIVQRTPDLGLTIRMKRTAAPAPASSGGTGGGGPAVVTWLPRPGVFPESGFAVTSTDLGDGRWQIDNGWGIESSIWEGTPEARDEAENAKPLVGEVFRCLDLEIVTSYWVAGRDFEYFGVIQGAGLADAQWTLEWDNPSTTDPMVSQRGHTAKAFANVVRVLLSGTDGSLDSRDTLTARASSGGTEVGVLTLTAIGQGV